MPAGPPCRSVDRKRMSEPPLTAEFLSLPKAELHLHLEGSIEPATVCELAARQGASVSEAEARRRYAYRNFAEFIEAFKWVTSYLRTPGDYALITRELAGRLIEQNVCAAEFRGAYDYAAEQGLHRLIHAGEIGGPWQVRDAVELLGVERIGHGIGATHDPALLDLLAERRIPLEICPTSNLLTGALARLRGRDDVGILDH